MSASATTCTCCDSTRRSRRTGARSGGRGPRRTCRSRHPPDSSREVTLWMSNGGRPAAAVPRGRHACYPARQLLGTVRGRGTGSRRTRCRFRRSSRAAAAAPGEPVELKLVTAVVESAAGARHARRSRARRHGRSRGGKIALCPCECPMPVPRCRFTIGASARSWRRRTALLAPARRSARRSGAGAARCAAADSAAPSRTDRRSADGAARRLPTCARCAGSGDRSRRRQLERRPRARDRRRSTRVQTLDAAWLARDGGGLGMPALLRAARDWRRGATISPSTSSRTSAATCSSPRRARPGPPDTGAAAAARCSMSRSSTTRARIRPTTRDGSSPRCSAERRSRRQTGCSPHSSCRRAAAARDRVCSAARTAARRRARERRARDQAVAPGAVRAKSRDA